MRLVPMLIICSMFVAACSTSPTGRRQPHLLSDAQMTQLGRESFAELRKTKPIAQDTRTQRYVQCVASAVARQAPQGQDWEVVVFEDDTANAFALPGGKIGVHTGLLEIARNQHQLAAVLGHEVAHVIARHANARMSLDYATAAALQVLGAGASTPARQQVSGLLGLGVDYGVLLPYGRAQEEEADIVGLGLMARAGFDPRESIALWQRMARASGSGPPAFLSTHPSHGQRIETLGAHLEDATAMQRAAVAAGHSPQCE